MITAPGKYFISSEKYHFQCCDKFSVSASSLRILEKEDPEYFHWKMTSEPKTSAHFDFGKAAHTLLIEPDLFHRDVAIYPEDVLSSSGAINTAAAKEFANENKGKALIKPEDFAVITAMSQRLQQEHIFSIVTRNAIGEISLIDQDPQTGIYLKARPDFLPQKSEQFIVDYKTTADLSKFDAKAIYDFGYHIQAFLQIRNARAIADIDPAGVLYVVQEKKAPYRVDFVDISYRTDDGSLALNYAETKVRKALDVIQNCLETDHWPSRYGHQIRPIHLPLSATQMMLDPV